MDLVGDIGGTKSLLALVDGGRRMGEQRFLNHEYQSFDQMLELFLADRRVERVCLGIAGPIENQKCVMTNLRWQIDAVALKKRFNVRDVFLLNDLEASAWGVHALLPEDFFVLNEGRVVPGGTQAIISAGTGLGEAIISFDRDGMHVIRTEGGHSDFAPRSDLDVELLLYLRDKFGGHISWERVLSGAGLVQLYHFLRKKKGGTIKREVEEEMRIEDPAIVISRHGLAGSCSICEKALSWFCTFYGQEAGNLVLKAGAVGGCYIGGGIAPKILKAIKKEEFILSFFDKGRFSFFMQETRVQLVLREDVGLVGAESYCQQFH